MSRDYEVRVDGQLGDRLARCLKWSYEVVPPQTVIRVQATTAELRRLLQQCIDNGVEIEQVRRLDLDHHVSTGRELAPDVPRHHAG